MHVLRVLSLAVFAFTMLCFRPFPVQAQTQQAEPNQIAVSASGKVSVKPDIAEFGVVVESIAKNADQAVARTAEKHRAVQQALRQAGVPADDAPTASYTVSPRWKWDEAQKKNVSTGYTARHLVMVKVRTLSLTGKAVDAAVGAGADEVQQITFSSSRYEELRREALAAAVQNARRDAEIIARAAGGRLGGVLEVSVAEPGYGGGYNVREVRSMESVAAAPATEITPSEQDIFVQVNTRWKFVGVSAR